MSLAAHSVQLALLVSGETDVLHGVRQPLAHHLLHPDSVPAVNETVETNHGNLLGPGQHKEMLRTQVTTDLRSLFVIPAVETQRSHSVRLLALLDHDRFGVVVARVVSTAHLLYHVLSHSPQRQAAVPGAGHQELIVQPGLHQSRIINQLSRALTTTPYLVKNPVRVGIFSDTDRVEGWKTVDGHVVAVPGSGGQQGSARVDLDTVDAAVLNLMGFKFL